MSLMRLLLGGRAFGRELAILRNEGNQGVLLASGQLPETLQQFPFVQGELGAVQAQAQVVAQGVFLKQALLQTCNDFRVHAAVMAACYIRDAFTHAIG
ncbi:hypothetical protein GCM10017624_01720 [Azotobacter vinelandii]|nr:hypothetical protein GCM10017624_01720 [Azotobacter vinelandii]